MGQHRHHPHQHQQPQRQLFFIDVWRHFTTKASPERQGKTGFIQAAQHDVEQGHGGETAQQQRLKINQRHQVAVIAGHHPEFVGQPGKGDQQFQAEDKQQCR
ncbi:hypothetical protein D3C76_1153680 [compost metagenome]